MANSAIAGATLTDLKTRYQDGSLKIDYGVFSPTVLVSSNIANAALGANFKVLGSGNRTINVHNMKDGQSVTMLVQGAVNNVITLQAYTDAGVSPLTVKFAAGQSGTMASTWSMFTVMAIGGTGTESTLTAGSFSVGTTYQITTLGSTNFTLIGASSNTVGVVFTATGVGTGNGTATTYSGLNSAIVGVMHGIA